MIEADSIGQLLAGATTDGTPIDSAGKSGARLERVTIGGQPHVVKYLDPAADWTMRAAGVAGSATRELWRRGILADLPDCINQPIVGIAYEGGVTVLLMRDVGDWLVPVSDDLVPLDQHLRFLDHMAAMHATFWQTPDDIDIVSNRARYLELSPHTAEREAGLGSTHVVPPLIGQGWPLLAEVAPTASAIVTPLANDPSPLVDALASTPQTLVHGNWKLDNLGTDPEQRTILLDWELPGRGPAISDLAWYLAINCRRLPHSKEEAIVAYREALERRGIDTGPWWSTQLGLCLLGALVQFGWEKAFSGYDDELVWWERRAVEAADLL
jgi:Phosphotransferase enzyme family